MKREFNMLGTISEDEIDEFEDLIHSLGEDVANIEFIEGFLTAVVCSPKIIPMSEILPCIIDEDFSFPNDKTASSFFNYLLKLKNTINEDLMEAELSPESMFVPYCLMDFDDDSMSGVLWANGFMAAFSTFPEISDPIMMTEGLEPFIGSFMLIAGQNHPIDDLRAEIIPKDKEDEFLTQMFVSAVMIYHLLRIDEANLSNGEDIQPQTIN